MVGSKKRVKHSIIIKTDAPKIQYEVGTSLSPMVTSSKGGDKFSGKKKKLQFKQRSGHSPRGSIDEQLAGSFQAESSNAIQ